MKIIYTSFPTSIGKLFVAATNGKLVYTSLGSTGKDEMEQTLRKKFPQCGIQPADGEGIPQADRDLLKETERQITQYLEGTRKEFDIPYKVKGTEFQEAVWAGISQIPYGQALTYQELAYKIGRPKAVRAVGGACGSNAIPLIIPCHRVVASGGGMGGFGGGIELKKKLLRLESGMKKGSME